MHAVVAAHASGGRARKDSLMCAAVGFGCICLEVDRVCPQQAFLQNLQDLSDLEEAREKVVWPTGHSALTAAAVPSNYRPLPVQDYRQLEAACPQQAFLQNLEDFIDLEEAGEKVVWPTSHSALTALAKWSPLWSQMRQNGAQAACELLCRVLTLMVCPWLDAIVDTELKAVQKNIRVLMHTWAFVL